MQLTQLFLAQLEREAVLTQKVIDRVPEGRNDFKPHVRSMPLGYLAGLVAGMLGWIAFMIERDELILDDPSSEGFRARILETKADLHPFRSRFWRWRCGLALLSLHRVFESSIECLQTPQVPSSFAKCLQQLFPFQNGRHDVQLVTHVERLTDNQARLG